MFEKQTSLLGNLCNDSKTYGDTLSFKARCNCKWRSKIFAASLLIGLTGCSSPEVDISSPEMDLVKNGYLSVCLNHTFEDMVTGFFGSPSWESGESDSGVKYINVSGDMIFHEEKSTGMFQFTISSNGKNFQYSEFKVNGIPQDNFTGVALLKKMCNSAGGVVSDYKKKSDAQLVAKSMKPERDNISSGVRNLQVAEEAYYADNQKYIFDLSELAKISPSISDLLEIANVKIEKNNYDLLITAQSKKYPSIIYNSQRGF